VMNADGSDAHVVCGEARCGQGLAQPEWSPDSRQLVFSNQGVVAFIGPGTLISGIWVANVDGSGVRKLTQPRCAPGTPSLAGCVFVSGPSWSPNGASIVFSRFVEPVHALTGSGGQLTSRIELMAADGSHLRSIAKCPGSCSQALEPVWSPDGTRIAYAPG